MTKKEKTMLVRIAVSAVLLIAAVLVPYEGVWRFLLFFPAYFVIGWDVLWRAVRNIAHGQVFDENFLMALATVGAFCTGFFGQGEYPEAVFVMLFYQVGELFQNYAVEMCIRDSHGRGDGNASLLFNFHPVGHSVAGVAFALYHACQGDGTAVQQEFFRQSGFTGVRVGDDGKSPPALDLAFQIRQNKPSFLKWDSSMESCVVAGCYMGIPSLFVSWSET